MVVVEVWKVEGMSSKYLKSYNEVQCLGYIYPKVWFDLGEWMLELRDSFYPLSQYSPNNILPIDWFLLLFFVKPQKHCLYAQLFSLQMVCAVSFIRSINGCGFVSKVKSPTFLHYHCCAQVLCLNTIVDVTGFRLLVLVRRVNVY